MLLHAKCFQDLQEKKGRLSAITYIEYKMLKNINTSGAPVYFTGTECCSVLGQEDMGTKKLTPQLAVEHFNKGS